MITSLFLRKFFVPAFVCLIGCSSYAQKTEIKINAYSGFFFFRGNGSSSASTAHSNDTFRYWNFYPYGRKSGFSYSPELVVQRVTKQNHLYGLGISWEELKSKSIIDTTAGGDLPGPNAFPVKGKAMIATSLLTINPFFGQRFIAGKIILDIVAGIDLARCTKVRETAKITDEISSHDFTYKAYRRKPSWDIRSRVQINASYNRIGVCAGYSLGLTNYIRETNYFPFLPPLKAYSNFLRLGVSYTLK